MRFLSRIGHHKSVWHAKVFTRAAGNGGDYARISPDSASADAIVTPVLLTKADAAKTYVTRSV
jgi:hypothetical protein